MEGICYRGPSALKVHINDNMKADSNLMHHFFLWVQNWTEDDFKRAFKNSNLGWDYQWNKFINERERCGNASNALLNTILNMDDSHQKMLFDFITGPKYGDDMKSREQNIHWMAEVERRAKAGQLKSN